MDIIISKIWNSLQREKNGFYGLRGTKKCYRRSNKDPRGVEGATQRKGDFDGWMMVGPYFVRQLNSYVLTQDLCSIPIEKESSTKSVTWKLILFLSFIRSDRFRSISLSCGEMKEGEQRIRRAKNSKRTQKQWAKLPYLRYCSLLSTIDCFILDHLVLFKHGKELET